MGVCQLTIRIERMVTAGNKGWGGHSGGECWLGVSVGIYQGENGKL